MARINVEESLFSDPRFDELTEIVGSKFTALGMVICAWRLAQQYHLKDKGLIPVEIWQKAQFGAAMLRVELAKQIGNFVYVRGANEQFNWLSQRSKAGKIVTEKKLEHLQRARDAKSNKKDLVYTDSIRKLNDSIPLTLSLSLEEEKKSTSSSTVLDKSSPMSAPSKKIIKFESFEDLCDALPEHKISQWKELYIDELFIERETKKSFFWYKDNPRKTPRSVRGWCLALSSWLERSWQRERKMIPSNKQVSYIGFVPK